MLCKKIILKNSLLQNSLKLFLVIVLLLLFFKFSSILLLLSLTFLPLFSSSSSSSVFTFSTPPLSPEVSVFCSPVAQLKPDFGNIISPSMRIQPLTLDQRSGFTSERWCRGGALLTLFQKSPHPLSQASLCCSAFSKLVYACFIPSIPPISFCSPRPTAKVGA